jgi:hypothetical protein
MRKILIILIALSLAIPLLTATPAKAGHWSFGFYWPGFTVGIGVPPPYYYPAPPPPGYYYPPAYYYGEYCRPGYGYYGGCRPREYYGGPRYGNNGDYHREYNGGPRGEYYGRNNGNEDNGGENYGGGYRR